MKLTVKGRYSMGNLVKNLIIRCPMPCLVHFRVLCFVPDSLDSFVLRFVMGGRA